MKTIIIKGDKKVETPWLKPAEAAAYCGVSRNFMDKHGSRLPHGGSARTRLYHVEVLDRWINNELDIPFTKVKPQCKKKGSASLCRVTEDGHMSITCPATGKVFQANQL